MTNPFEPTHDLYIIPMKELEREIKNWFLNVKKINLPFDFGCEKSESSFDHMGDLYFNLKGEELSEKDRKALQDTYPDDWEDDWCELPLNVILRDFFETNFLSYDVEPYNEKVHIRIRK